MSAIQQRRMEAARVIEANKAKAHAANHQHAWKTHGKPGQEQKPQEKPSDGAKPERTK